MRNSCREPTKLIDHSDRVGLVSGFTGGPPLFALSSRPRQFREAMPVMTDPIDTRQPISNNTGAGFSRQNPDDLGNEFLEVILVRTNSKLSQLALIMNYSKRVKICSPATPVVPFSELCQSVSVESTKPSPSVSSNKLAIPSPSVSSSSP